MARQVDRVLEVGAFGFEIAWLGGSVIPLAKPLADPPAIGGRLELRGPAGRYALGVPRHYRDAPDALYLHWQPIEQGTDPAGG